MGRRSNIGGRRWGSGSHTVNHSARVRPPAGGTAPSMPEPTHRAEAGLATSSSGTAPEDALSASYVDIERRAAASVATEWHTSLLLQMRMSATHFQRSLEGYREDAQARSPQESNVSPTGRGSYWMTDRYFSTQDQTIGGPAQDTSQRESEYQRQLSNFTSEAIERYLSERRRNPPVVVNADPPRGPAQPTYRSPIAYDGEFRECILRRFPLLGDFEAPQTHVMRLEELPCSIYPRVGNHYLTPASHHTIVFATPRQVSDFLLFRADCISSSARTSPMHAVYLLYMWGRGETITDGNRLGATLVDTVLTPAIEGVARPQNRMAVEFLVSKIGRRLGYETGPSQMGYHGPALRWCAIEHTDWFIVNVLNPVWRGRLTLPSESMEYIYLLYAAIRRWAKREREKAKAAEAAAARVSLGTPWRTVAGRQVALAAVNGVVSASLAPGENRAQLSSQDTQNRDTMRALRRQLGKGKDHAT